MNRNTSLRARSAVLLFFLALLIVTYCIMSGLLYSMLLVVCLLKLSLPFV